MPKALKSTARSNGKAIEKTKPARLRISRPKADPAPVDHGESPEPLAPETLPIPSPYVGGRGGHQPPTEGKDGRLVWKVEDGSRGNYARLGRRLAMCPGIYRNKTDGMGLIQVLPSGKARLISTAAHLAPLLADSFRMVVTKKGKIVSEIPTSQHLNAMLRSEAFLTEFQPVDEVARAPYYLDDFTLAQPGYHDGGPGQRVLYVGPIPEISDGHETTDAFLDVMDFASPADRTNAVAAVLTVFLRHRWHGEKPIVLVTATKSHAGKGTICEFAQGTVPKADILYESLDWPMQSQFQRLLQRDPDLGVLLIDNVRLDSAGGHSKFIRSAFIESFVTNAQVTLASPSAGEPVTVQNRFVVMLNSNDGALSQDILNRSLPIHLAPKGSIYDRESPIGHPKLEFLPRNRSKIDAELRGMIDRWREAGCPPDESVRHPMTPWAQTIGGILRHNGFTDFLANLKEWKSADEPKHHAIGIMGAVRPDKALQPLEWARIAVEHGLVRHLIPVNERDTEKSLERAIGVLLKPLVGEAFEATTKTHRLRMRLDGGIRRWAAGKNPHSRYRFEVLASEPLAVEGEG